MLAPSHTFAMFVYTNASHMRATPRYRHGAPLEIDTMPLIKRDRNSARQTPAHDVSELLDVMPYDHINAFRINGNLSVSVCTLVACAHGLPVKWFQRERGADVMVDTPHADYFTSEAVALDTALRRADALHQVHIDRARKALETRNAAYDALVTYGKGKP